MNLYAPLLLFSILLLCCNLTSSTNIPPGSSLYASNGERSWSSADNTFSLGFTKVGPTSYIFSISYQRKDPIWTAGGASTTVDSNGAFHFSHNGTLLLINGSGATVWDSNTANLGITSALLDDSGNLILMKETSSVWSTFENPTDCIVPSQNFTVHQTLRSGAYSLRLLSSGNLSLTWNDSVMYWNQRFSSSATNLTSPSLKLQPSGVLQLSDGNLGSQINVAFGNDYGERTDLLKFLRLDKDGNFRMYTSDGGSLTTATVTWAVVSDQCQVFGYCGNWGICSYDVSSSTPICGCPSENFEFFDANDHRQGCKRKVELESCVGSATMLELKHTKFLTYKPEEIFTISITGCKANCLSGGFCIASSSLSDGTGYCYLKRPDFVSGYMNPALPGTSYVMLCAPAQPNRLNSISSGADKRSKCRGLVVGIAVLATAFGLVALFCASWCWWYSKNSHKLGGFWAQYTLIEYASGAPVQFSYKELHNFTKGFKDKLGTGGFGSVYKGVLANRTSVAVKQLEGIEQGEKQFRMEVITISSTHHLNLVRLIGFCSQGRHRLLVYEFMKNGSLDNFLFTAENQPGKLLNWRHRFNIALGTARGITYLHEECRDCIVHCDIKPENILLDENFNAKVSDFGLAKLINSRDHRHRSLNIRGTRGYFAPEWLANLPITSKSDVYSYGLVLLEVVSGRRNFEISKEMKQKTLSLWAYAEFEKGGVEAILDKRLVNQDVDMDQVTRAVQASFWCIQEHPSQRPTMGKVVQMLEGIIVIPRPPAPKALAGGSIGGISINLSSKDSAYSASEVTGPAPSSSSSFQAAVVSPTASGMDSERASSSLLELYQSKSH